MKKIYIVLFILLSQLSLYSNDNINQQVWAFGDYPNDYNFEKNIPPAIIRISTIPKNEIIIEYNQISIKLFSGGLEKKIDDSVCSYLNKTNPSIAWQFIIVNENKFKVKGSPKLDDENIIPLNMIFTKINETKNPTYYHDINLIELNSYSKNEIQYFNQGVSFAGSLSEILTIIKGKVIFAQTERNGFGGMVMIDHGKNVKTIIYPLETIFVKEDQEIKRKEKIGIAGKSDNWPKGKELHLMVFTNFKGSNPYDQKIEPVDPVKYNWENHVE